jgi:transposase
MTQKQNLTQEQKLVVLESAREIGIRDAAKQIGVHYTTVYGWRKRLEALGEEGFLADRARSPGRGIKKISIEKEKAVLETWERHSGFGPSQVRNQLRRQGITISTRSVVRIMEANGYRGIRRKREKGAAVRRFEASRPLELAQIDILEFFINKQKGNWRRSISWSFSLTSRRFTCSSCWMTFPALLPAGDW